MSLEVKVSHQLEFMKPDSKFGSSDMIEFGITALMCRIHDFAQLSDDKEKKILLDWHRELCAIRNAVRGALGEDE